jgi:hypothetical protein
MLLEFDWVWFAIMLVLLLTTGFVVGPGVAGVELDTLSTMVTHDPKLTNGFAMACAIIILCLVYYVWQMLLRWQKRYKEIKAEQLGIGMRKFPLALGAIYLGAVTSTIGIAGFGVVSMNVSEETHTRFAGLAFGSILMFLAGFLSLAWQMDGQDKSEPPHSVLIASVFWIISAVSLYQLGTGEKYYWEYVLVVAACVCAVTVTIPSRHRLLYTVFGK